MIEILQSVGERDGLVFRGARIDTEREHAIDVMIPPHPLVCRTECGRDAVRRRGGVCHVEPGDDQRSRKDQAPIAGRGSLEERQEVRLSIRDAGER